MLKLNVSKLVRQWNIKYISIHLMLKLNLHKLFSHLCNNSNFNTSHVEVKPSLIYHKCKAFYYFNTSHVEVKHFVVWLLKCG